ncbi:hypothetical protein PHSY_002274 [Pseudozyma hubeiensis SY62]|uniref:Uncharacterized protein n=1 Tax=Pseudozyma hubeiensis (strain SY62) TaxID=1305764 RepID=R9P0M2_PSEHS|nr:hypothetical protein PHSY_002274 [Pseudozyma hubeiensis SY62]GAC94701.1 hypothetical protein PHSY_002274 [Pseudozyma hubeiensis SY62]
MEGDRSQKATLETLVARFVEQKLPRPGEAFTKKRHNELIKQLDAIVTISRSVGEGLVKVVVAHNKFHRNLRKEYVFVSADRSTGPFVLKRKRAITDSLPPTHEYHITLEQSQEHNCWLDSIHEAAI